MTQTDSWQVWQVSCERLSMRDVYHVSGAERHAGSGLYSTREGCRLCKLLYLLLSVG